MCLLVYIWISSYERRDALENIFQVNFFGYAHWFMSIIISQMGDHSISVYQAIYATSIVDNYFDTAIFKTSKKAV